MLKLFSCKMCKDRERFSSFESSYCFALFQNTLTLKNSFIRAGFNGFIYVQSINYDKLIPLPKDNGTN